MAVLSRRLPRFRYILSLVVFSLAIPLQAELLVYDPFAIGELPQSGEYALGQLVGQDPFIGPQLPPFFSGPWQGQAGLPTGGHIVEEESLVYGLLPSQGGSVQALVGSEGARAGRQLSSSWDSAFGGTLFMSMLVNFGVSANPTDGMGYRALEFWDGEGQVGADAHRSLSLGYSQFGSFECAGDESCPHAAGLQSNPITARMAVEIDGQVQILPNAPGSFNEDGKVHLLVFEFEMHGASAEDRVAIYLDPATPSTPEFVSAEFESLDFELGLFGVPSLFGGTGLGPEFDELRIGTTYQDVVPWPEPSSACEELDAACYNLIYHHLNKEAASSAEGDLNGDGTVDLRDIALWRANRTDLQLLADVVRNIPEPASVWLLSIGHLLLAGRVMPRCEIRFCLKRM